MRIYQQLYLLRFHLLNADCLPPKIVSFVLNKINSRCVIYATNCIPTSQKLIYKKLKILLLTLCRGLIDLTGLVSNESNASIAS